VDAFAVRPGEGIGPIAIGMTRSRALQAANDVDLRVASFVKSTTEPEALAIERQLFVYFDSEDQVEEIEVGITSDGTMRAVLWDGIDLTLDSDDLIRTLDAIAQPDRADAEYPASSYYPDLGLALWMDATAEDWVEGRFESILVRRPGPRPRPSPTAAETNRLLESLGLRPLR
jgi:hypothetical protein